MKTILSVLCLIGVVALITSCDNGDSGGSSGGGGDYPQATYKITATGTTGGSVTCYDVDSNVKTSSTRSDCTWNCAYYLGVGPRKVVLTFSVVTPTCPEYVKDADGNDTAECVTEVDPAEFTLSNTSFNVCAQ